MSPGGSKRGYKLPRLEPRRRMISRLHRLLNSRGERLVGCVFLRRRVNGPARLMHKTPEMLQTKRERPVLTLLCWPYERIIG
jgi:hypothetical protein